jgi:hypothetical protein
MSFASDKTCRTSPNKILEWILSASLTERRTLNQRVAERTRTIRSTPGVLLDPNDNDGVTALAVFLEYASSKHMSPKEAFAELQRVQEDSREAVMSLRVLQMLGHSREIARHRRRGDHPSSIVRRDDRRPGFSKRIRST